MSENSARPKSPSARLTVSPLHIAANVQAALDEDIGSGDITAALIPEDTQASAIVITRENGVVCGRAWVDAVFASVDPNIAVNWQVDDGQRVTPNDPLFSATGSARHLLTAERTALNFLQLMSGTATACQQLADIVSSTKVKLLDTRKTIPGLRLAQKYAVTQGSCYNHRIGLYDAFLVKENHIAACGGIAEAASRARQLAPGKLLEIEVEGMGELRQALAANCDRIMLDNFTLEQLREAVELTAGKIELEASGNVAQSTLLDIANTGIDYISIGALTKDCKALDLSMRLS
ncbi:MAG: nicotinate-nucleotide pyrophosphorylase (carboxylating) [Halioglobus sp.]|jgi:nicotinate-nucleotide pyrophosphorylase (carboxylating)